MKKITKNNIKEIIEILQKTYPDAKCSLNFSTPYELLIAVLLSAQCTDERVNKTTPHLFKNYNTPEKMENISLQELEEIIKPCGFYKNKAKNIKTLSKIITQTYNGNVPSTMKELITLPGIGRKSANVMMTEVYNNPQGIAVDTHAKRIANRLNLTKSSDPNKIEQDLLKIIPKKYLKDINHLFMWHGRNTCTAKKPQCERCCLKNYCEKIF